MKVYLIHFKNGEKTARYALDDISLLYKLEKEDIIDGVKEVFEIRYVNISRTEELPEKDRKDVE